MDTETPPDPRGVPHHLAIRSLTAPELIDAYQAVRDAPIPETAVMQRQNGMMRRELAAEGTRRSGRAGDWFVHARSPVWSDDWRHGDNGPGSAVHEQRRAERIARQAKSNLIAEQIHGPLQALKGDFEQRVRDGRIVASWIDLTHPADGARDYPSEVAALIIWQINLPKLGQNGPVLTDLRYRRAATEAAPAPASKPDKPTPVPKPSANLVLAAATSLARDLLGKHGRKPTQDEVVADMLEEGFGPTESWEAVPNLPAELKRRRGEHDRTLASDARWKPKETGAKKPKA